MRDAVYLDTSGWLAALSPREQGHKKAHQAYQALVQDAARLVTTNLVVAEMHILLTRRHDPATGLAFLESLPLSGAGKVLKRQLRAQFDPGRS